MKVVTLAQLKKGQSAKVISMDQDNAVCQKLLNFGVLPQRRVRYVKSAPMGDPLEFEVEGTHFSVRRQDAQTVLVEVEAA